MSDRERFADLAEQAAIALDEADEALRAAREAAPNDDLRRRATSAQGRVRSALADLGLPDA